MDRHTIEVAGLDDGIDVAGFLGMRPAATVVLNGSTSDDPAIDYERLAPSIDDIVGALAPGGDVVFVTGGTDAGVFTILGRSVQKHGFGGPLVGVVPRGRVDVPELGLGGPDAEDIEPHHTHLVVVDGETWGDETPVMLGLLEQLSACGPVVAVMAGGGAVAAEELDGHRAAGRDIVVLAGGSDNGAGDANAQDSDTEARPGARGSVVRVESDQAGDVVRNLLGR